MSNITEIPTDAMKLKKSVDIVKTRLYDETITWADRTAAIKRAAEAETYNQLTKLEFQIALRWLFEHYDFELED